MKLKVFSLRLLVTLIAWLALLMPTAKLNADNSPLCFTAKNGSVTVRFDIKNVTHTIQYSTDSVSWNTYTSNTNVLLNANEKVYFRAESNQTTATAFYSYISEHHIYSSFNFSSSNNGKVEGSGNIMSLYGPDCPNLSLPQCAFRWMFEGCHLLTTAPELPATTLAENCYLGMFSNCQSLTKAPELPATTLSSGCYSDMFDYCISLTTAPELPATTLAENCYFGMFRNCQSLTRAPELPATTISPTCYGEMFYGCTSLTTIPELPATIIGDLCYFQMFRNCTSLIVNTTGPGKEWSIPAGATHDIYFGKWMFTGTGGNFTGAPNIGTTYYIASDPEYTPLNFTARNGSVTVTFDITNLTSTFQYSTDNTNWSTYTSNTPINLNANGKVYFRAAVNATDETAEAIGWDYTPRFTFTSSNGGTVEGSGNIMSLYGPDFPDIQLPNGAFSHLFYNCTLLTSAPVLPSTKLGYSSYYGMFSGCTGLTEAPELPATTVTMNCYANMFSGCTSLVTPPVLPALNTEMSCYESMFSGCTSLTSAPALPATYAMDFCYQGMFWNCTSLVTPPTISATDVLRGAYSHMFANCSSLVSAPALLDTELYNTLYNEDMAERCYEGMFSGCTSLTTAPDLPATSVSSYSYAEMFSGCTSLTSIPDLPVTNLRPYCYHGMFANCSSLTTVPTLPATTMEEGCYGAMFARCTSLKYAPVLPSEVMAESCYSSMFSGCTSLIRTPELPATKLATSCYDNMFKDCTGLTTLPELPAETLAWVCYKEMFKGCTSLKVNTSQPGKQWKMTVTNTATNALLDMFNGTTGTMNGTPIANTTYYIASDPTTKPLCFTAKNSSVSVSFNIKNITHTIQYSTDNQNWDTYTSNTPINLNANEKVYFRAASNQTTATAFGSGDEYSSSIFTVTGTGEVEASGNIMSLYGPDMPNLTLPDNAFAFMFNWCTALTTAPELPATNLGDYCYRSMFQGCTSLVLAPSVLPAETLATGCYLNMFTRCQSLVSAPKISANTLADYCCHGMFSQCTGLVYAPKLPVLTLENAAYMEMFKNCTSLRIAPKLPATELAFLCYKAMFSGCTSLTKAPTLPAIVMNGNCYTEMFNGCTSLITPPALPALTLADGCYSSMFKGCTSLTYAPVLPAKIMENSCYQSMLMNCTSLTSMPQLPATTLAANCYSHMFYGCSSLNVSDTPTGVEWMIPSSAYPESNWNNETLGGTCGDFDGNIQPGTTYYIKSGTTQYSNWDGSNNGNWDDPTIWSQHRVPNNSDIVTINGNVYIPEDVNAQSYSLTLSNWGALTVSPRATLNANTITCNDSTKLIIQSDSANTGTVRFASGTAKATVQMCFKGTIHPNGDANNPDWQYRGFIGNPYVNQTLQNIVVFEWDEALNGESCWGSTPVYNGTVPSAIGVFEPWTGYSMANYSSANAVRQYTTSLTPTATGKVYNMSCTTTGTGSSASENCGVNLLTNSYSAPINLSDANIEFNNAESTVYFFNTRTNNDYNNDRYAAITAYPTKSGYAIASTPYIPAGQSFAVKATADGATLTIPASAISTVSSGAMYAPAEREKFGIVKITVESDEAIDEVYLMQSDECTSGFDNGYDGTKMFSTKTHQIYAQNEYGKTAVNADKTLLGQFVGFKPMVETEHAPSVQMTITAIDIEGYDELYLYDYVTDKYIAITDEECSYTFSSTGEETPRRFQIVGKAEDGTEYKPKAEPRIEVAGNEVYLMNFERGDAMVILSDAAGRTLWSVNAKNGNTFTLPRLAAGVYFVSCGKTTAKYVQH